MSNISTHLSQGRLEPGSSYIEETFTAWVNMLHFKLSVKKYMYTQNLISKVYELKLSVYLNVLVSTLEKQNANLRIALDPSKF